MSIRESFNNDKSSARKSDMISEKMYFDEHDFRINIWGICSKNIKCEKKLNVPGSAGGVAFSVSCDGFDNTYLGLSSPAIISFWVKRRSGDVACIDNRAICDRAIGDKAQIAIFATKKETN